MPAYFAFTVAGSSREASLAGPTAYWTLTPFGTSTLFKVYSATALLIENVLPLISLIILNKISLVKFKQIMWRLSHDSQRADKVSFSLSHFAKSSYIYEN
jgi:hypothetical protein